MDACYYYQGGRTISQGGGLSEKFLWNFLDNSPTITHPGYSYWMPLPSIVAAAGLWLFSDGFRAAQLPFLLLAALFPVFVAWMAIRWTQSKRIAVTAGFLSIFSGFYSVYWMNVESFLLYAWIGGLLLVILPELRGKNNVFWPVVTGVLCGFAHLTRADGLLFPGLAVLFVFFIKAQSWKRRIGFILLIIIGYATVIGFWYVRNISEFGGLFPPGNSHSLWLISYNDLFHFPATDLTPQRFLESGWKNLLATRWEALLWNVQTLLFVMGFVFLAPFIACGIIKLHQQPSIKISVAYFAALFFLMTLIFPLQGSRGGLFHSSAALISVLAIAAAIGLDRAVAWIGHLRSWNPVLSQRIIFAGIIALAFFTSAWIFQTRVVGTDYNDPFWSRQNSGYLNLANLLKISPSSDVRFMVNNPPCFTSQTEWEAVAIPDGDISALFRVANQYDIQYVILDSNTPAEMRFLYTGDWTDERLVKAGEWSEDGRRFVIYQMQKNIMSLE